MLPGGVQNFARDIRGDRQTLRVVGVADSLGRSHLDVNDDQVLGDVDAILQVRHGELIAAGGLYALNYASFDGIPEYLLALAKPARGGLRV